MNLPCITDKCLKYPVCKHKLFVTCQLLNKWLDIGDPEKLYAIKETYPNIISVRGEDYVSYYRNENGTPEIQAEPPFEKSKFIHTRKK